HAGIRRGAGGAEAEHGGVLLQSGAGGSDFVSVQLRRTARGGAGSAGGSRVHRQRQPSSDGKRSEPGPGPAATGELREYATGAPVSAVQQRHVDQPVDRELVVLRWVRASGEADERRPLVPGSLHVLEVS